MAQKSFAEQRLDRMYEMDETYRNTLAARATNRDLLRGLIAEGDVFTTEQVAAIKEVYPDRAARATDDEDQTEG